MPRLRQKTSTGRTILVVDDQEETLISTRRLLEDEGHRVRIAQSGADAIQIMQSHEVHVLVVDYFMPQMTGAELIERVRASDPYIQIILQTGYSGEKPPAEMLDTLDIQGYHDKADSPERLITWIKVALRAHDLVNMIRHRERLQSELVANCSHEFRTPLNIIFGYLELLNAGEFGDLPADANEALASVMQATRGLADLVEDFLSHAKIEAGIDRVDPHRIPVTDLAQEMARVCSALTSDTPVEVVTEIGDVPDTVTSDPIKLQTILRNLVVNAAKFTSEGTITIRVAKRSNWLAFEVEDTGCGIAPDDTKAIFEPFRQVNKSASKNESGTGLGLALSRQLGRLLGGHLRVKSDLGKGSTFTLLLPLEVVIEVDSAATDATSTVTQAAG